MTQNYSPTTRILCVASALLLTTTLGRAQQRAAPDLFREDAAARSAATASPLAPALFHYRALSLDLTALRNHLAAAPLESQPGAAQSALLVALPLPDGSTGRFLLVEAPIMEPALAAQLPGTHTYAGRGLDDPQATLRCDLTSKGFHAQILSPTTGTIYLDPASATDTGHYLSFFKRDINRAASPGVGCSFPAPASVAPRAARPAVSSGSGEPAQITSGGTLRIYRAAVGATAEYTAARGGTVASAQASIVTTMNRVVGVYEKELAVRLTLVNNTNVVYTDPATDGYSNTNPGALLTENQAKMDNGALVGSANYDIGHVFGTGGGGLAGLGVVCVAGQKARGETGSPSPTGDAFDIDYVAHEMGHQFGGNHTFNSELSNCGGGTRNPGTAFEPGSGSTIMAYAGICSADNLQVNSDAYFHTGSFEEMQTFIQGTATCNTTAATGNTPPTVSGPSSGKTLPIGTPFRLTATATDAESDALTYCWEEVDLGPAGPLAAAQVAGQTPPLFRSYLPTASATRYFPRLSNLVAGTTPTGERLPTVTRTLSFRCTARDQHNGPAGVVGGVSYSADVTLSVSSTAGPFLVTAPNTAVSWAGNSTQAVTWDVAGTTAAPVSCARVNLRLSLDGGLSYPLLLASNEANDGSASVTLPNVATAQARVMVEAAANYFFDISNANFTITAAAGPTISSLTPNYGPVGAPVVISGAGFGATPTVSFNGIGAVVSSATPTSISVTVPAGATNGPVVVTASSVSSSAGQFQVTPILSSLNPTSGAVGATVIISGSGFGASPTVTFGGVAAVVTASTPTSITVTVPAGASTGAVVVTADGAPSNELLFTVLPFRVTALSPARNGLNAGRATNVALTFSAPVSSDPTALAAIKVFSAQAGGRKAGSTTANSATLSFDPSQSFRAGELVSVTTTTAATSAAGAPLAAGHVHQFTTASSPTTGVFTAAVSYGVGAAPRAVVAADVNNDSAPDLLVTNTTSGTVSVLLNSGSGSYSAGPAVTVGSGPRQLAAGDLNNDGRLDFVTGDYTANAVSVRLNDGSGAGTFTAASSISGFAGPQSVALADMDGDGNLDLLVANFTNPGVVSVVPGDGSGSFSGGVDVAVGVGPLSVALADMNNDGWLDILTANNDNTASIALADGSGDYLAPTNLSVGTGPQSIVAADFNRDGRLDFATANLNSSNVSVYLGDGNSGTGFGSAATIAVGNNPYSVAAADVNGDGNPDLIATNFTNPGNVRVLPGNGAGLFLAPVVNLSMGNGPRGLAVADLDNDGSLDLAVANNNGAANSVSTRLGTANASLPVELVSFTAQAQDEAVALRWRTASEQHSAYFEVERSADGRTFAPIGRVAAQGSTDAPASYAFRDDKLTSSPAHYLTYYRLRQVDTDGSAAYSPVAVVERPGQRPFEVYPTQVADGVLHFSYRGPSAEASLTVYNMSGQRLRQQATTVSGRGTLAVDGLAAGWYVARLATATGSYLARFYRP